MSKYIDKDKVLEYIIFGVVGKDITCGELTRAIESIPSIEVSEGEWENYKDEHRCTACGEVVIGDWYDFDWYYYCPNCGARMNDKE